MNRVPSFWSVPPTRSFTRRPAVASGQFRWRFENTFRLTAIHEAGHAVAAIWGDFSFSCIMLVDEYDSFPFGRGHLCWTREGPPLRSGWEDEQWAEGQRQWRESVVTTGLMV